jgi:uncharacterized protein YkwD
VITATLPPSGKWSKRLLALLPALLLIGALTCAACSKPPTPASGPTAAQQTLSLVNQYRQSHNQPPLMFDDRLADLAQEHNVLMRRAGKLSHEGFDQRFGQTGRRMCVENVSWNAMTPTELVNDWRNSPGHNANLLNSEVRYAGIALDNGYATYLACD